MSRLEILNTFDGKVYFRGISFSSVADIDMQINNAETMLDEIRCKLKQLAAATPISITPSNYTPLEYVNERVDDYMDDYQEACRTYDILIFARAVINDYAVKNGVSLDEAFEKCYVDKWADLKQEINENNKTKL